MEEKNLLQQQTNQHSIQDQPNLLILIIDINPFLWNKKSNKILFKKSL